MKFVTLQDVGSINQQLYPQTVSDDPFDGFDRLTIGKLPPSLKFRQAGQALTLEVAIAD
ncbi:MAG: hypothetical protein Q7K44_03605 [Candidatus Liptonbacteria bacterium]|nr:hypothetical protein [Candidatus Liptonbacteria bacterium]